MTFRLITIAAILCAVVGCRNRDIRESHVITDFSKPVLLTFKLNSGEANAGYKIKGHMNGSLGYSEGILPKGSIDKFPSYPTANKLGSLNTTVLRKYVRIFSDSINTESNSSIGQSGLTLGLYFIPGTATKGKIEIEFWEQPIGLY